MKGSMLIDLLVMTLGKEISDEVKDLWENGALRQTVLVRLMWLSLYPLLDDYVAVQECSVCYSHYQKCR